MKVKQITDVHEYGHGQCIALKVEVSLFFGLFCYREEVTLCSNGEAYYNRGLSREIPLGKSDADVFFAAWARYEIRRRDACSGRPGQTAFSLG